ncbi:hypothetical protein FACS189426_00390 [Bacteroidia bacterium]|nr:hypothetical protein FACS189426_00390 [Bacteroidia bacterium]
MTKALYTKPFLSLHGQMAQLKSRGMKFADEAKALHLLKNVGYYRFSGYWYPLLVNRETHVFKSGATFESAFNLYKFDRELRKLIIGELEKIEVAVRTQMTYSLSVAHGPFWLDDETLFANPVKYIATLDKINSEMRRSDEDFISWLHGLTYIRNICAHHARLWNRFLQVQPLFPRRMQHTWISIEGLSNRSMYYILSMIVYFLNTVNPKHTFRQKIGNLLRKYPNVDACAMGFPVGWYTEPLWQIV